MKRILILFIIFCSVITAKAQFGVGGGSTITGKISGTVIDSISKKPMDYATVSIFRSGGKAPINGVLTDEKGSFKINNLAPGKYKITVTFIGYPTKTFDPVTTTLSKPDNNMGVVILAPSSKALKEVTITGQQAVIETKIDKIVYNAEKDLTSVGGTATDILRKVPLVAVDINGNVSLRGDQNVKVLINGKPSGAMSNNLADVLRSFPADQIKNIEVITAPSAKYDAEGSAGIINIVTKSKNVSGVSGSVSGGIGTRQNNGNANLNIKKNRLNITGNFGGNFNWPQTTPTELHSFNDQYNVTTDQKTISSVKRVAYTGAGSLNYDFNNYNSINSTIRFNHLSFSTDGNTNSSTLSPTQNLIYSTLNNTKTAFGGFDWNAAYTHKFKQEGHELSIAGQWSHGTTTVNYSTLYSSQFPSQQAQNGGTNNEYTAQVDYVLPISKKVKLEAGGKTISRVISSLSDFYNQNTSGGAFIYNPTTSNIYDYNQYVYAGYSVFTFTLPKGINLQAGVRDENTRIDGNSSNSLLGLQPFTNNYNTFVPSLAISKTFKSVNTFKLSYSKRIQRPSLQFLNPFINSANIQNQTVGNPSLSPEVSQTIEFNYSTYIKASVINASIYYKRTTDVIEGLISPLTLYVPNTSGKTDTLHINRTNYFNVGTNKSIGMSFFGSITPITPLTFRASINAFTYNPNATSAYQADQSSNGTFIQYNIFSSGSLTLKKGFTAEMYAILTSPRRTIQGTNPSFGFIGFGMKKDILNKKASIGINTLSPFKNAIDFNQTIVSNHFVQTSKTAFPFRSVGLTFSYNFGKLSFSNTNPMQKKKGVNNDDLKQGDQNSGGMGNSQGGPSR